MTRWSRDPYALVLTCIGATLVVFVLGVSVVLAAGHSVPAALWAVGGAAVGVLTGALLPRPRPLRATLNSSGTPGGPGSTRGHGEEPRDGVAAPPRSTPPAPVVVLALVAVVGLTLSVLFYAVQIPPAGCELRGIAQTPACETTLLDLAAVFIFIASTAGGTLLGIYVPRPEPRPAPPPALVEPPPGPPTPPVNPPPPPLGGPKPPPPKPGDAGYGLPAALAAVAIVVLLGAVVLLLSLLPRATVQGARDFHIISLVLIVAAVGLTVAAFTGPAEKRQGLVAGAVLTAVLAFVSSTASGFVLDRFTKPTAGPAPPVTVKAYVTSHPTSPAVKNYFSAKVTAPTVKVELGSECTVYLVHLDEMVDDEPHIADHLPGKSFPLDQGARACGLKRATEVDAIAAVLAAR